MGDKKVIEVRDLCKRYRLGVIGGATLGDELKVAWARMRGKPNPLIKIGNEEQSQREGEQFWALRDVAFDVEEGEILGIIGRNGAGKSTLLKLLSRITLPTDGEIRIRGRSSSLLEVGTGFHPELTGRENIYLNGAILGMDRKETNSKLDEIIEFSGIKHHIDTPVKRYSSGMKVRLGFAVAAHLDPEILIIDEVLAVGDAEFQRKCLGKMRDVAGSGRTILFVSHNMLSVQSLCTRTIWLREGRVHMTGATDEVVREYLKEYTTGAQVAQWSDPSLAPGNNEVRLHHMAVNGLGDEEEIYLDTPVQIELCFENICITDNDLNISFQVFNDEEVLAFTTGMGENIPDREMPIGRHTVRCTIPGSLLNAGVFRVSVNMHRKSKVFFQVRDVVNFEVLEPKREGTWFTKRKGVFRFPLDWEHEMNGSSANLNED